MDNLTIVFLVLALIALWLLVIIASNSRTIAEFLSAINHQLYNLPMSGSKDFSEQTGLLKIISENLSWISTAPRRQEMDRRKDDDTPGTHELDEWSRPS